MTGYGWQAERAESMSSMPPREPVDPAARVLDDMGREWAAKSNGVWGAIGTSVTVDSFAELVARYGVMDVLA